MAAADVLRDQRARGVSDAGRPDFPREFLRRVADGLMTMRLGHRESEINGLLASR